jgi:hypothetical protein
MVSWILFLCVLIRCLKLLPVPIVICTCSTCVILHLCWYQSSRFL